MLPPFYYKGVSEDGVFAYYSQVIEGVGDSKLKICLYHIPHLSGVAITRPLIARLLARYPETVIGIKDSGGDFANTKAMLDEFPDFRVFCGSETFLTDTFGAWRGGVHFGRRQCQSGGDRAGLSPCGVEPHAAGRAQRSAQGARTGADDRLAQALCRTLWPGAGLCAAAPALDSRR